MYHIIEKITVAQFNIAVEPFRQWLTMDEVCGFRPKEIDLRGAIKTVKFDMVRDGDGGTMRRGYVFLVKLTWSSEAQFTYWVDTNDDHVGTTLEFSGTRGNESNLRNALDIVTLAIAAKLLEKADRDHIPQGNLMLLV